jgi:glycosyltransferase involved in cell wall biosynthesis
MQFRALRYIVEPEPGISHARNAAVDNIPASADFVALIDDDEVPEPRWIQSLLDAQRATDADIITGPTLPVFPADTPAWIIHSGYFCKPRYAGNLKNLQSDPPTASCNVMLRASLFTREKFRFDPALAFSGGEDKLLFQNLKLQGFRFTWAADAMVHETIPEERATLAYMLREEYRRGTVKHYVKMRLKADSSARKLRITARTASRALLRLILSTGQFMICKLINRRDKISGTLAALAVADAAGTLAGTLGIRRRHYRS